MSTKTSINLPDILLIGATGRTGRLVLDSALKRGHKVVALIRPSSSLPPQANLTVSEGSPLESAAITTALSKTTGPVVIISTLGQTRTSGNPFAATTSPPLFMSHSASAVVGAAKAPGSRVQKLVLMSMFGTGSSFTNLNCLMRATMLYSNMKQSLDDQNAVDEIVKQSDLTFVIPRPAMLKGEVALPVKSLGDAGEEAGFMPSVSAHSCAEFMLDAAVSGEWDGKTPVLSN
ncbi:NAD-dependent epimerase/dehydratase-like protein, partial [Aureobasidium melanogenum]